MPKHSFLLILAVLLSLLRIGGSACASESTNPASPPALSAEAIAYLQQLSRETATNTLVTATNQDSTTHSAIPSVDILDDEHKLSAGDRVSLRIVEDKEDPKPLIVADSGDLEIPYLGRVNAAGKTCLQLSRELKVLLEKKYYFQATVVIAVDFFSKSRGKVYLAGRVRIPGYLEIPPDEKFTVSKAILRAGGFSEFADKRHVKVTRRRAGAGLAALVVKPGDPAGEGEVVTINVAEVLEKGQAGKDLELEPDDRVYVPSRLVNF